MSNSEDHNIDPSGVVHAFWQNYLNTLPPTERTAAERQPEAWSFGDSPALANELADLVLQGVKTATCSLVWYYEFSGERVPQAGDYSIILDGAKQPLCVIQTTEISIKPYLEVDAAFAAEEGEGDRSLAYWRAAHRSYFSRECPTLGRTFEESAPLVCERFKVVWPTP